MNKTYKITSTGILFPNFYVEELDTSHKMCELVDTDGKPVVINMDAIMAVEPVDENTNTIYLTSGDEVDVRITYGALMRLLTLYDYDISFPYRKNMEPEQPKKKGFHPIKALGKGLVFIFKYR
jgi:hypothetical protein